MYTQSEDVRQELVKCTQKAVLGGLELVGLVFILIVIIQYTQYIYLIISQFKNRRDRPDQGELYLGKIKCNP